MGLIKAAVGAIGSTLKDQWKEAIDVKIWEMIYL